MTKLLKFIEDARANQDLEDEIEIGIVGNQLGRDIAYKTGIKTVSGAIKILTSSGVRHAFVRHGVYKDEDARGQIPLTNHHFIFIADILSSPNDYYKGDQMNRKRNEILVFEKKIKGHLYKVLVSVVRGKDFIKLIFNTMVIKK